MLSKEYPLSEKVEIPNQKEVQITECPEGVIRCDRIELKPSNKQRYILKRWFSWYRWAYNQTVVYLRKDPEKKSFYSVRKGVKDSWSQYQKKMLKQSGIPMHSVDNAIHDVLKAYKSAYSNKANGNIRKFIIRCKKKRCPKQTMTIEASAFSKRHNSFAVKVMGKEIKSNASIKGIDRDSRLTWDTRHGTFTLFAPIEIGAQKVTNRDSVCSLDPGIRTFQTVYSKNSVYEFGSKISQEVRQLLDKIEALKSHEGKRWYSKYSKRLYDKVTHKVDDLHWKTTSFLAKNYDTILLGSMSTADIVKSTGNLHKRVRPIALLLKHFSFKQRLIAKAEEFGAEVIVVNEAWTSKTCGGCFERNHELGRSKIFRCPNCPFVWDRDFNGARNIMLKHFGHFH